MFRTQHNSSASRRAPIFLGEAHLCRPANPGIVEAVESGLWNRTVNLVTFAIRIEELPAPRRNEAPERVLEAAGSELSKELDTEPLNLRDTLLAARPANGYNIDLVRPRPMQV